MSYTSDFTVCIVLAPICLVITLVTLGIAIHFSCRHKCKCGQYESYERPLKKKKAQEIGTTYTELKRGQEAAVDPPKITGLERIYHDIDQNREEIRSRQPGASSSGQQGSTVASVTSQ